MNRDAIDFGKTRIPRLFIKLFIPTLMGLLFGGMLNVADGIFVGRGVGSDALAAINIAAPVFMIFAGLALMFGAGVSVVAAIHLSHGNTKAANINITQAFTVAMLVAVIVVAIVVIWPERVCHLFGGNDVLEPYVVEYLRWVAVGVLGSVVMFIGLFVIRLDGSPQYAMLTNVIPALLNIGLDWYFVFPAQMGIGGAAMATSISELVGSAMVIYYLFFRAQRVKLYKPKFSHKAIRLTMRNIGYMMRLGLPTLLGEIAMSCMMIVGNYMFIEWLHEDGVAAFSVSCYLFPLVFMFGNAIAQSSLPIVSYNYGQGNVARMRQTFKLSVATAIACGLFTTTAVVALSEPLMRLFLGDQENPCQIGIAGLPLFALGFALFTINVVLIGYLQSIERSTAATVFMLMRGMLLVIPCFVLLPTLIGIPGLWLAVPLSELLTLLSITIYLLTTGLTRR